MPNLATFTEMTRKGNNLALEYFNRVFKIDCVFDNVFIPLYGIPFEVGEHAGPLV